MPLIVGTYVPASGLKELIHEKKGIPVINQQLKFADKILEEETLQFYGIAANSEVNCLKI